MPNFSEKIMQFASKRKWQADPLNETICNIQFTNSKLTFIRAISLDMQAQFVLSLGTPEKYLVSDISKFRHELSNLLLYQNSIKKGFWSIFEARTPMGFTYFPGYTRIIAIQDLEMNTFNEVMDDIISEFDQIN